MEKEQLEEIAEFCTLDESEGGSVVYLRNRWGHETKQWIKIRGTDSAKYRRCRIACMRRRIMEIGPRNEKRRAEVQTKLAADPIKCAEELAKLDEELAEEEAENDRRLVGALVMDWSFSAPCSEENVLDFLRKSPRTANMISTEAENNERFFGEMPKPLSDMPEGSSD